MARIALDNDTQQLRAFIPSVKKLPPNPHIGRPFDAVLRGLAPPSETTGADSECSPEPLEEKGLRHQLLVCDQRSFFTGSASADLQAAHIINAVRRNPERKKLVEDLLSQQRLQDPSLMKFSLDSITNAILLEANLHVHWDLYGTFCIVPSESDASAMLEALHKINKDWAQLDHASENYMRPLDISKPPFSKPHWEIVVLHPRALLPDRQPLVIAQDRTLYPLDGEAAQSTSSITWIYWIAVEDHLCSVSPPHVPLDPFVVPNVRSAYGKPCLSSLAIVINAHYKLDQFMQNCSSSASPRVQRFAELISDLVTAIFFVPQADNDVPTTINGHAQVSQQGDHTAEVIPSGLSFAALGPPIDEQNSPSGTMEDSSEPPGEDLDAVEPPETPDEDGLTASEFRVVAARAKDPLLDPKQRAVSAMTMIFGTRRYEDP